MNRYTASPEHVDYQDVTCAHCGMLEHEHHADGRCYTTEETLHRLRFYQRTRRWPGADEGCEEVDVLP